MKRLTLIIVTLVFASMTIHAQEGLTEGELAKEAQNPIADLISVPFQNNTTYRIGDNNSVQNILNIQPIIPLGFEKFNVITRTIIPIVSQPNTSGGDNHNGLGDINITAFFSPKKASEVTWGFGPIFQFPTASSDEVGTGLFAMGPAFVIIATQEKWVYGFLVNNIWSFDDLKSLKIMTLQPIVNYNLPKAWYLVSAPIWQANWRLSDGNQWLMPLGGGLGKVIRIGKLPININAHVYYNVKMQDPNWGRWQSRFQISFLFPKGR